MTMFISRSRNAGNTGNTPDAHRIYRFPYRLIKEKIDVDMGAYKARLLPLCTSRYNMQGEEYFMQTKKLDDLGFQFMERCSNIARVTAHHDMLIVYTKDETNDWHLVERLIRGIFCLEIVGDSAR